MSRPRSSGVTLSAADVASLSASLSDIAAQLAVVAQKLSALTQRNEHSDNAADADDEETLDDHDDITDPAAVVTAIDAESDAAAAQAIARPSVVAASSSSLLPSIYLSERNTVKLNVGGRIFVTSHSTLQRDGGMLAIMSRRERDSGAELFIDRDPTLFNFVLNYCRDGAVPMITLLSPVIKQRLLKEARFYQLSGLIHILCADAKKDRRETKRELSSEKEYRLMTNVSESALSSTVASMTMGDGWEVEQLCPAVNGSAIHLLLSKKLSRGELMLLDRLQNGM